MDADAFSKDLLGSVRTRAQPQIHLECGLLEAELQNSDFRVADCGFSFKSHWPMRVGTELTVELSFFDARDFEGVPVTCETEGVVVESSIIPESNGCYRISLLFVD